MVKLIFGILVLILIFNTVTPVLAANSTDSKVYFRQISNTTIQILQKPPESKQWQLYLFKRITSQTNGKNGQEDVWRIYRAYNANLSTKKPNNNTHTNLTPLTNQGNWEKAVQIGNTLVGGLHGYEKHVKLQIIADHKSLKLTPHKMVECSQLTIREVTDLTNPKKPYNTVAHTTTTYTYTGKSLYITNDYNWTATVNITRAYAAMLPVNNHPAVSSVGQIKGEKPENLTLNMICKHINSPKVTTWNLLNTLHMSVEVLNPVLSLFNYSINGNKNAGRTWINPTKWYNKIYITLIYSNQGVKITKGTTWTIKSIYKIWG